MKLTKNKLSNSNNIDDNGDDDDDDKAGESHLGLHRDSVSKQTVNNLMNKCRYLMNL